MKVSARSHWFFNLLVVAMSIVVALVAAEGAARLFVRYVKPNIMVLDDEIGWKQRSHARRSYLVEGHVAHVTTREKGTRGKLYQGQTERRRILVLGDSFTAGLEVSDAELFSSVLDELRPDLEIVNAGVGAYGTVQELLMLQRLEPVVEPDCILLMAYVNDLTDNVMPFAGGMGPRPYADADGRLQPMGLGAFRSAAATGTGGALAASA